MGKGNSPLSAIKEFMKNFDGEFILDNYYTRKSIISGMHNGILKKNLRKLNAHVAKKIRLVVLSGILVAIKILFLNTKRYTNYVITVVIYLQVISTKKN